MRVKWNLIFILAIFNTFIYAQNPLVIAISATPSNLSPFFSTDANSQNINKLIHMSLVELDKNMEYKCRACDSFKEKIINGKHEIIFKIKSDLQFSDGSLLTIKDVENSVKYFSKDQQIKSTFMESFENLESVTSLSGNYVKFVYKKFSLENLSNLSTIKIVKIFSENHENLQVDQILGAGDYVLKSNTALEIQLQSLNKSRPDLIFKVVKDETTLALKLLKHEIDLSVASLSPRKAEWLIKKKNLLKAWEIPSSNYIFLGLNQNKAEFKDLRVRQAISYLIPRDNLLKYKLKGTAVISTGMFSPAFPDYNIKKAVDEYSPKKAMSLLSSAGFVKNKNGIYEKQGKEFQIDWKVSNNKSSIETVEVLKSFFEKNGIMVKITISEWGTYMSNFKSGKFDIVMGQWIGFNGPDMLSFVFHSENIPPKGGNRIRYFNKNFDDLINMATVETNHEKRKQLYNDANKIVTNDYAYISLWHPNILWIGSSCLKNIELDPTGGFSMLPKVVKNCE